MPDFVNRILTEFDTGSFRAYIAEVQQGIAQLAQAGATAASAALNVAPAEALASTVQQSHAAAQLAATSGAAIDPQLVAQLSGLVTASQNLARNLTLRSTSEAAPPGEDKIDPAAAAGALRQQAAGVRALAASDEYVAATTELATEEQVMAAAMARSRATSDLYVQANVDAAAAKLEEAAALAEERATNPVYLRATVEAATAKLEEAASISEELAKSQEYVQASARAAAEKNNEAAALAEQRAANQQYLQATARLATARSELATAESQERVRQGAPISAAGQQAAQADYERALVAQAEAVARADLPGGIEALAVAQGEAAASDRELAAATQAERDRLLAGSDEYIAARAQSAESMRAIAAQVEAERAVVADPAVAQLEVANALRARAATETEKLEISRASLDPQAVERTADLRATEQARNILLKKELEAAQVRLNEQRAASGQPAIDFAGSGRSGGGGGALGGLLGSGGGGALGSFGGILATGAIFSGGFALVNGIRQAMEASIQLDQQLTGLQNLLEQIGQGDQFGHLRQQILQISRDTGVAATQVAQFAQEFTALTGSAQQGAIEAAAASQILRVFGGNAAQLGPQIGALAEDFGTSVTHIGDSLVEVSNRSGRAGQDILAALGGLAPVAASVNLSFDQMSLLIEAVGAHSARSGQQIGDLLARALPQLQSDLSKFQNLGVNFSPAAIQGDTFQALIDILQSLPNLSQKAQESIAAVFGPRQAQVFAALFADPARSLRELNGGLTDNGQLAQRNAAIQETLGAALARARQEFQQMAEALLHAGLLSGLTDLIKAGGDVFAVFDRLIGLFDLVPAKIREPITLLAELVLAMRVFGAIGGESLVAPLIAGFQRFGASIRNTITAKQALTVADGEEAAAAKAEAEADATQATAATAATGSSAARMAFNFGAARGTPILTGGPQVGTAGMLAIGAIGAIEVQKSYDSERSKVQASANALTVALTHATDAQVQAVAQSKQGLMTSIADFVFGVKTAAQQGQHELASRQAAAAAAPSVAQAEATPTGLFEGLPGQGLSAALAPFSAKQLKDFGIVKNKDESVQPLTEADIKGIEEKSKQTGAEGQRALLLLQAINSLTSTVYGDATVKRVHDEANAALNNPLAIDTTGNTSDQAEKLTELTNQYQAGELSRLDFVHYLRSQAAANTAAAATLPTADPKAIADRKQAASDLAAAAKADDDALTQGYKNEIDYRRYVLGLSQNQAEIPVLTQETGDPGLSVKEREAAGRQLVAAVHAQFTQFIQGAGSVAEVEAELRQGFAVPAEVAAAIDRADYAASSPLEFPIDYNTRQRLYNSLHKAGEDASQANNPDNYDPGALQGRQGQPSAEDISAGAQRATQLIQANTQYQVAMAQMAGENAVQIGEITLAGDRAVGAALQADVGLAQKAYNDAVARFGKDSAEAKAAEDALNNIQLQATQNAASQASDQAGINQSQQQLAQQLRRSKTEFYKALFQNDPVASAEADLGAAKADLGSLGKTYQQGVADLLAGRGSSDEASATIAYLQASNAVRDALAQSGVAQINLLEAMAQANGDVVGAARLSAEAIQQQIKNLLAAGASANDPALLALRGQLAQANANITTTTISFNEQQIQTDLQLNRITVAQAVDRLRQLEQLATNQTERDQIEVQIQQLLSQAGSNLSFNLPTDINLPTLYEVRRLNQTPGGSGYSDNRNINIQLYVNNQLDLATAANLLAQAVGTSASQFGVAPRTY